MPTPINVSFGHELFKTFHCFKIKKGSPKTPCKVCEPRSHEVLDLDATIVAVGTSGDASKTLSSAFGVGV